jgi:hypothetical protein|nr:MAG TPA: tailspike protein [Caudoviricetes sp.]
MTISTSNRRAGPYLGDGIQREFPFTFKVFSAEDVRAYVADPQGGENELAATAYRITLSPNQETRPGGVLHLNEPLATDNRLTLISVMPVMQPMVFTNQGGFFPDLLNAALDRLTIYVQQLEEIVARCMVGSVNGSGRLPPLPSPVGQNFLRWSSDGTKIENYDIGVDGIKSDIARLKTAVSALTGGGDALAIYQKIEALSSKLEDLTNESSRKLNQYAAYMKKTRTLALAGL